MDNASEYMQCGRDFAAHLIEDEARAYEAQFGADGRGGDAAGVLWEAAKIARGEHGDKRTVVPISRESLVACVELFAATNLSPTAPGADDIMSRLAPAYREIAAALSHAERGGTQGN